jgi:uncharacterized membrane protein
VSGNLDPAAKTLLDPFGDTHVGVPPPPGDEPPGKDPVPVPELTPGAQPPRLMLAVTAILVLAANFYALSGVRVEFAGPALAFWLLVAHPAYLLSTTSLWKRHSAAERVVYSLAGAIFLLLVGGLFINTVLPLVGVTRPLDLIPVLVLVDVLNIALLLLRRRYPAVPSWRLGLAKINVLETRVLVVAGVCIPLAVIGAIRLNNGHGNGATLVMLVIAALALVLLLGWSDQIASGITAVALYFLSAALLLMTSLRGWSVTGHDVQTEYRVFQLTAAHGRWDISFFRDAYNACLSITMLPTEMSALMRVDDPYIYKVFFQIIFASCPVIVYLLSRRFFSNRIAIVAAIYFVSFPTFFTDMPFLNRQETALLFVGVAGLAITNPLWKKSTRQIILVFAAMGVELSHYSTSYVFLGTLVVTWLIELFGGFDRFRHRGRDQAIPLERQRWANTEKVLSTGCIVFVLAITVIWGGLATRVAGGAEGQVQAAVSGFVEHTGGAKSSATSYGLFSGGSEGSQKALDQYRKQTLQLRKEAPRGSLIPASVVARYPTMAIATQNLPLTRIGKVVDSVGVAPSTINGVIRSLAAKGEQAFILIGLLALLFAKRFRRAVGREYFFLCIGGLVMLGLITVLPSLSVDYGVLRVFQEELIFVAPVLVVGSVTLFQWFGQRWSMFIAAFIALLIFTSTTGLMPEALGGYPAQLNLNNSGSYYQNYYMNTQEVAAVSWLSGEPGTLPGGVQVVFTSERFAFTSPSKVTGKEYLTDVFPTLLRKTSWVIADTAMVDSDEATATVNGNLIGYRYPTGLLTTTKNLVFDNGKTRIYQ